MDNQNPQSWYDLPLMQPMDPRSIVSFALLDDNTGISRTGVFLNSATFNNATWAASPLTLSPIATATTPSCQPVNPTDFDSIYIAQSWTASHGIIAPNASQLPATVSKIMFFKAGGRFITIIYLDWAGGVTSTDIQLSMRDNTVVGGNLIKSQSTVPVFSFTGNTFGGTGRKLTISSVAPARVPMTLRVIDNSGNWSMFEMDWNIVP
jgi:hypothetical protein